MKKILVTGATGFIGSNLVRRFIRERYVVHILKRKESDAWRIKDIISELHIHDSDLTEKKSLFRLMKKIRPDFIFHLANLGLYGSNDSPIGESIKVNLLGTINLIESVNEIDYKGFINTGSSSEYGTQTSPMKESDICQPETNYALTKLAATLYANYFARKNNKPIVTLRLFSPFGPFDHSSRFIAETILKMLKRETISIKNPTSVRDYIFVNDVIDAFMLCMRNGELSGEIFNIGNGKQTTIKEVVRLLQMEIGFNGEIMFHKSSYNDKIMWQADIKKAKQKLGWYPKITLTDGLKETVQWFRRNAYLYG